jgi:predicted enzyme related to lactoylglutathione lyase
VLRGAYEEWVGMKKVTGLGGVFFKTQDRKAMIAWYREHLGIDSDEYGFAFQWRELAQPEARGYTVWSPFKDDTAYFAPSTKPFMVNFRVHDLEALLTELRAQGVQVVGEIQDEANGRFAWILDPEGNKVELWQPVESDKDPYLPQ